MKPLEVINNVVKDWVGKPNLPNGKVYVRCLTFQHTQCDSYQVMEESEVFPLTSNNKGNIDLINKTYVCLKCWRKGWRVEGLGTAQKIYQLAQSKTDLIKEPQT